MSKNELRGLSVFGLTPVAIAYGAKRVETRSWRCPEWAIGTQIAIHASKTRGPGGLKALEAWMLEPQNIDWLVTTPYMDCDGVDPTLPAEERELPVPLGKELPRGVIVALATIEACEPTEALAPFLSDLEWSHGDYTPGRWAWMLKDVGRLTKPVEYSGALGLFKIEPWTDFTDPDKPIRHESVTNIRRQKRIPVEPSPCHEVNYGVDRSQPPRQFSRGVTT